MVSQWRDRRCLVGHGVLFHLQFADGTQLVPKFVEVNVYGVDGVVSMKLARKEVPLM
jgi:hypothetical protein